LNVIISVGWQTNRNYNYTKTYHFNRAILWDLFDQFNWLDYNIPINSRTISILQDNLHEIEENTRLTSATPSPEMLSLFNNFGYNIMGVRGDYKWTNNDIKNMHKLLGDIKRNRFKHDARIYLGGF